MRSMSAGMEAKLAQSSTRLCKMLRVELSDGTVHCFTDHDLDLEYDLLGDVETYQAGTGILASDIVARAGLEPDNFEVTGPLSEITLAGVLGGRFNNALAWLFEVDWSDLGEGHIAWMGGEVGDARIRGSEFLLDIRNQFERLQQVVGRAMINTCDADHTLPIDPRCGRTPETEDAVVISAVDGMQFTATISGSRPDGYFNKGEVRFETGENAGVKLKIEDHNAGTGVIKLFGFLPVTPEVGDEATLIRGCGKTREDCMERDNMPQFRGEPDSPGDDQLRKAPIPGAG